MSSEAMTDATSPATLAICRDCIGQIRHTLDQARSRMARLTVPETGIGRISGEVDVQADEGAAMYSTTRDVCLTVESLLTGLEALQPNQETMLALVNAALQVHFKDSTITADALLDRDSLGKALTQLLAVIRHFVSYLVVNEHPHLQTAIREIARDIDLGRELRLR